MWSFPTLEPAIVNGGSFVIERRLDMPGSVEVRVGDTVSPETVVARSSSLEKSMTLFVASELGVSNDKVRRYLTRPIGSQFDAGEEIARARRGLRTAAVSAPVQSVLVDVDDTAGTVTLRASSAASELRALVNGEVERVVPDHGAIIRTNGSRVFGVLGFGSETTGRLVVGIDRHDRELTADQVKDTWKGTVVLTGMTVGVPALNRLRQVGVAGIIVGSLAEGDIRRFLTPAGASAELSPSVFWRVGAPGSAFVPDYHAAPLVIVVTEGFGRIPMAEPVFSFLRQHEGLTISMQAHTAVGDRLARPEMYIASDEFAAADRTSDDMVAGRLVRVVDGSKFGSVGSLSSGPRSRVDRLGRRSACIAVEMAGGSSATFHAANVEVLA